MEPSSLPAKRTFHLLPPPDISCANDNRLFVRYYLFITQHVSGALGVLGAPTVSVAAFQRTWRQNWLSLETGDSMQGAEPEAE
jgi:hypothetical protein